MSNQVLLNNIDHKNLRINTQRNEKMGDNMISSVVFPFEFRNLQAHYPIFFRRDNVTQQYQAIALLGLEENENLFLKNNQWQASYVPLMSERQPFFIGFQENQLDAQSSPETVIHVDMASPRISKNIAGEPLLFEEPVFLEFGGNSDYIERVCSILHLIHENRATSQDFINRLSEHALLESFVLDVTLNNGTQKNNGTQNRLSGFYTINEEKLNNLSSDQLNSLHKAGFLEMIYMAIASLSNIRVLIDKKNEKLQIDSNKTPIERQAEQNKNKNQSQNHLNTHINTESTC